MELYLFPFSRPSPDISLAGLGAQLSTPKGRNSRSFGTSRYLFRCHCSSLAMWPWEISSERKLHHCVVEEWAQQSQKPTQSLHMARAWKMLAMLRVQAF